jgi:O-antigen/teichoic acid export membrane protein
MGLDSTSPKGARHRLQMYGRRSLSHRRALEGMLIATQGAGVLASIVMARSLGPAGRGMIVTVTVWGQILGWLAALSLDKAIVVLSSDEDSVVSADEGWRAAQLPVLGLSVAAVVGSVLLGHHFFSNGWLTAAMASFAVAAAYFELVGGWLLARSRRQVYIVWRLFQPLLYLALLFMAAVLLRRDAASQRTVVMGLCAAVSMVLPVVVALVALPHRPLIQSRGIGPLLRFGAAAQVGNVLQYLNGRLDLLALSFLVTPQNLGFYAAGSALGQVAGLMAAAGFIRGLTGETRIADRAGLAVATALAGIVILVAPILVPAVFGAAFAPAIPIARILSIGAVASYALQGACGRLLGRHRPWAMALSQGLGVLVFGLGIAAFPTLQGVAWSSVISYAVSLLVAEVALRTSAAQGQGDTPLDGLGEEGRPI